MLASATQRLALPAGGRDEITLLWRIHFKARKTLENAQTPTTMAPALFAGDRVHAGLGALLDEVIIQPLIFMRRTLCQWLPKSKRHPPESKCL